MIKDMVISLLAAVVLTDALADADWWSMTDDMRIAVILGFATILFIFFTFLEEKVEKYRKYRKRVHRVQLHINALVMLRLEDKHEESKGGQAYIGTEENNIIGRTRLEKLERAGRG